MPVLSKTWSPEDLDEVEDKWSKLKVKIRLDTSPEEVAKIQLEILMYASELTWPVNQARLYEKRMEQEARREYTKAFLLSSEASDRKKDAEAKAHPDVRISEAKFAEAEIVRKLLEDKRDDAKMAHYALRSVMKTNTEDRFLG